MQSEIETFQASHLEDQKGEMQWDFLEQKAIKRH